MILLLFGPASGVQTLTVPFIAGGSTVYTPVAGGSGSATSTAPHIPSSTTVYDLTLDIASAAPLLVPHIASTTTVYTPTLPAEIVVPVDPFTRGQIVGRRVKRVVTGEAHLTGRGWLEVNTTAAHLIGRGRLVATGHVVKPLNPQRVLEHAGIQSQTLIDLSHEDDLIVALLLA
jgi:hypothetical protein